MQHLLEVVTLLFQGGETAVSSAFESHTVLNPHRRARKSDLLPGLGGRGRRTAENRIVEG